MGVDAATPLGMWERVRQIAQEEVRKLLHSGILRNASISAGGLTIKGGFLRMMSAVTGGVESFYVGPVTPALPDGTYQPGMILRRNDGTIVLHLYDPIPTPDDYRQFLAWRDRTFNAIFTDDTDSGVGIARPHMAHAFYPARAQDYPKSTAASWETVWRARVEKQQPKMYVEAWGWTDAADTTGQVQLVVTNATSGGSASGAVQSAVNSAVTFYQWPLLAVPGVFGDTLNVELKVQRTAGAGNVLVGAAWVSGWQS